MGTIMKARIAITLKKGVLDPQGQAISHALAHLGFQGVQDVKQGKIIDITLDETNPEIAEKIYREMCEKLLVNQVIENYTLEMIG